LFEQAETMGWEERRKEGFGWAVIVIVIELFIKSKLCDLLRLMSKVVEPQIAILKEELII